MRPRKDKSKARPGNRNAAKPTGQRRQDTHEQWAGWLSKPALAKLRELAASPGFRSQAQVIEAALAHFNASNEPTRQCHANQPEKTLSRPESSPVLH